MLEVMYRNEYFLPNARNSWLVAFQGSDGSPRSLERARQAVPRQDGGRRAFREGRNRFPPQVHSLTFVGLGLFVLCVWLRVSTTTLLKDVNCASVP